MIRFILAWFGYVKVPFEAVKLSLFIERFLEKFVKVSTQADKLKPYLDASRTITNFLRSGRLLQR